MKILKVNLEIRDGKIVNIEDVRKICEQNGTLNKLAYGETGGNPYTEVLGWFAEIENGKLTWKKDSGEKESVAIQNGTLYLESKLEADGENCLSMRGYFEPKEESEEELSAEERRETVYLEFRDKKVVNVVYSERDINWAELEVVKAIANSALSAAKTPIMGWTFWIEEETNLICWQGLKKVSRSYEDGKLRLVSKWTGKGYLPIEGRFERGEKQDDYHKHIFQKKQSCCFRIKRRSVCRRNSITIKRQSFWMAKGKISRKSEARP